MTHADDHLCGQLRRGGTARRDSVDPDTDPLAHRHRIAAPILVDGEAWGMVVALRDFTEFPRDDEKRVVRFAQLEETERANRRTRALSVMLVDVDNFKSINDRFGHATGDRVLVNLADSLRAVTA